MINEHNATGANWMAGHNRFSDWSPDEVKSILGYVAEESLNAGVETQWFDESVINESGINWIELGAVTPVKD